MIGNFDIQPPRIDDSLSQMVESHRANTGQDYSAILFFGLWGTADCSPEVRLYAAYRHLDTHADDGPAWLETARVHLEAGDAAAAEKILDELERLDAPNLYPDLFSEDPCVHRAYLAADTGSLDRALEIFDQLRVKHSDSPVYHYALGTVLHEKGDYAAARVQYEEALEALAEFRAELEAEDLLDESDVDFETAEEFLHQAVASAESARPWAGLRVLDLHGFTPDALGIEVAEHADHACGCGHDHDHGHGHGHCSCGHTH